MSVFSPSQTADFSFCPRYWQLRRAYRTRIIGYPELCGILGTAFSSAMEQYNKGRIVGMALDVDTVLARVAPSLTTLMHTAFEDGRKLASDTRTRKMADSLPDLLAQAVNMILTNDPLASCTILQSEPVQVAGGHSRPDVIVERNGQPVIVDYKLKVDLREQWIPAELDRYERSWQMYHYCSFENITAYMILLVILGPKPIIKARPYAVSPSYMKIFRGDASLIWENMGQAKAQLAENPDGWVHGVAVHANKFGPCEFSNACLVHGLDRDLIEVDYIRRGDHDGLPRTT